MSTAETPVGEWFSSTQSSGKGVEVKFAVDGRVLVRDPRNRGEEGQCPSLGFLPQAWEEFLRGVRRGEFDLKPLSMFDVAAGR